MAITHHVPSGVAAQDETPLSAKLERRSWAGQGRNNVIQIGGHDNQQLTISFHRTIRVADGKGASPLPPDMEAFPLYPAARYQDSLPSAIILKGGLFFPMYQREAMWINFHATSKFAINIYAGDVNVVSGEPRDETGATRLRRLTSLTTKKSIQDYVVTPEQLWIDGIATQEGMVRQFVAMPLGSGYSVEAQVTGQDVVGGLQFCVTPIVQAKPTSFRRYSCIHVRTPTRKVVNLNGLSNKSTIREVQLRVAELEGIPPEMQRLIYCGKSFQDHLTLGYYNIPDHCTIDIVLRLRGGGTGPPPAEMGIAAGGQIKQCILPDDNPATIWDTDRTINFNVQILNSELFHRVTGISPPETPISAATYAEQGLPFFQIWNEKSDFKGYFEGVKSVEAIDDAKNVEKKDRGMVIEELPWSGSVIFTFS